MGTPDFAVPTLAALHDAGHEIVAAYTQPPRRAGRGKKLQPSPVQIAAQQRDIPVYSPTSLKNDAAYDEFAAHDADIAVVAAYGLILPQRILDAPVHGCLNVHASLLPRWRGAAPIHWAIMGGDEVTGVTIMQMEAGLDTGPMLATVRTPVAAKTTGELTAELAELGAQLMVGTLIDLPALRPVPQDDEDATYAQKIAKEDARIDFADNAVAVERLVRAMAPFPGAWCEIAGERVKLLGVEILEDSGEAGMTLDDRLTIACGKDAIRPTRIQRAGKPAMDRDDFLRGMPVAAGTMLT